MSKELKKELKKTRRLVPVFVCTVSGKPLSEKKLRSLYKYINEGE